MNAEVLDVRPRANRARALPRAGLGAAWALAERELVRFFRQRNRLIGALGQPILFWVFFGAGLGASFRPIGGPEGQTYAQYFFPGVVVLIVLFTAIFATISIIEDRREGFLQEVLIAPAPRWIMVLGKVLGGTLLALIQAWLFLLLAPAAGIELTAAGFLLATLVLFVLGVGLVSLGVTMAWRTDSTQGFHAFMSIFLMPMWLLSGAFFPAEGSPPWLAWTIRLNPLTYGVAALRNVLEGPVDGAALLGQLFLLGLASLGLFALACRLASRRESRA